MRGLRCLIFLLMAGLGIASTGLAQVRVSGKVYDISQRNSLEAVTVISSSGSGTISDSLGRFSIIVMENDSIWFSYLNKPTPKYAVKSIPNIQNFEVSLHVIPTELARVQVMPRSYRRDSMQNREDYAKAFNFRRPGISTSTLDNYPGGGVGLDINEFINMFKFRRNRRMLAFQEQLLKDEELRYIDHYFNRALIIKLTGLKGTDLTEFIENYRPPVEFVQTCTDYEMQEYIKTSFSHFQRYKNMYNNLNRRDAGSEPK